MGALRELIFVAARGQNAFFGELADVLRGELEGLGVSTAVSVDAFPALEDGRAFVLLAPHEFAALCPPGAAPGKARLQRTVAINTEQPGTPWFDLSARFAVASGAVLDINPRGVRELRELGIGASHLQLGHTKSWERPPASPRDVDVTFLAGASPRRNRALSLYGSELWRHRCRLILADNSRPSTESGPSFRAGADKLDLLARSRVLLNVHRDERPYFEWQRVLEAIHCGALVVSEHSTDYAPLVPGEHFLSGELHALHHLTAHALAAEESRSELAAAALEWIRDQIPMRLAAERIAAAAEAVLTRPVRRRLRRAPPTGAAQAEPPLRSLLAPLRAGREEESAALRAEVKRARLEQAALRRRLEAAGRGLSGEEVEVELASEAHGRGTPRVSVVVPLYNHAAHLIETLESVAASAFGDLELIVVDDASTDGSGELAREWLGSRPNLASMLLRHPVNRGLPATRNDGIDRARGEAVLPLDSDNVLYPSCIGRLVDALDADPRAAFSYGILELFDQNGPFSIGGIWGWEPERLLADNYIDALTLIRRGVLTELGGFTDDQRLHGLEDLELWLRIAKSGGHGAHVPEIVARYRADRGSMLSLTGLSRDDARAALREREPRFVGVGWEHIDELAKT